MNLPIAKLGCALLFSLLLIAQSVPAQRLDSLKHELELEKDHPKFWTLYEIAFEFIDREDFSKALDYVTQAKKVALVNGDSLQITKITRVYGHTLRKLDRTLDGLAELIKARDMARRNNFSKEYYFCLNPIGNTYDFMGYFDLALEAHFEALNLSKEYDKNDAEKYLNNIGLDYYKIGNPEKAKEYYLKALEIGKAMPSDLYCNIALSEIAMKQYDKADISIDKAISVCTPKCSEGVLTEFYFVKARLAKNNLNLDKAASLFQQSYLHSKQMSSRRFMISSLTQLADLKVGTKQYVLAEKYLKEGDALAKGTGYNIEICNLLDGYANLYKATGEFEKAVNYQQEYIKLYDSIMSNDRRARIMQIHTDAAEKDNQVKIAAQEQILRLKEEAIARQRKLNILVGTVATLMLLVALMLVKQVRDKNSINMLLDRKVIERTKSLEETVSELVKRQADTEQFILATMRDIQSPLSSIKGLSHLFLTDAGDAPATKENVHQLQCVIKSLADLHERLNGMHQISQINVMPLPDRE